MQKVLGRPKSFTPEQEDELVEVILDMEKRLFGLTRMDVRRLAYRYCEANRIPHNFNHNKELAGNDWLDTLMKNNPKLAPRKPEPTSLARASGFDREKLLASLMHTSQCFSVIRAKPSFSQTVFLMQMKRGLLSVAPLVKLSQRRGNDLLER